jgi:hypothetical protein
MIEESKQINIKDLAFDAPQRSGGVRPAIDFSRDISFPEDLWEYTPIVPEKVRNAVNELDRETGLFISQDQLPFLRKNNRTWRDYIKGTSIMQNTGLGLLLIDSVEQARSEARDLSDDESSIIKETILQLSEDDEREGDADILKVISSHPKLLAWIAEIITFKESTLSLPDHSKPELKVSTPASIPVVRKF